MWRRPAPWPARRAGGRSWSRTWAARGGWRSSRSTTGTPAEIMEVAAEVLGAGGTAATAARSVRSTGGRPWALGVAEAGGGGGRARGAAGAGKGGLADAVAEAAAELDKEDGTLAVVVPRSRLAAVAEAVGARLPGTSTGTAPDLTAGPVVLPPEGAKVLEFDSVLVVDRAGSST